MRFGPQVERWRLIASNVSTGIPVDLVLGIIWHESRGRAGEKGKIKTRCALIPSSAGPRRVCRALGLMQVVPRNIASWNQDKSKRLVSLEDMTGKSGAAARKQIQLRNKNIS